MIALHFFLKKRRGGRRRRRKKENMDEREELHDKTLLLLARLSECSSLNCSAKKKGQQISKEKAREKKGKQGHLCLGVHERKNEKS